MSRTNVRNIRGAKSYHSPIRPWLRGPALLAGAFLLISALFLGVAHGDWLWHPIVMGLVFISLSRTPVEMRQDGLRPSSILKITAACLAVGLIALALALQKN